LTGTADSWAQRDAAEAAAAQAPGVTEVNNHITVTSTLAPEPVDEIC
jgi:osmotically-inducible protein OsmY